ncbi:hypothetical protein BVRB_6g132990 [Beta vulgaris subsp. vulgaris]|nr:hypothetical protein BVRB_6g132990 [Beta vulgaris subsp. vulgaris]
MYHVHQYMPGISECMMNKFIFNEYLFWISFSAINMILQSFILKNSGARREKVRTIILPYQKYVHQAMVGDNL